MNIAAIKTLADRSPVARIAGTITKVWPPTEQSEADRKNNRHRQNVYIKDDSGELTVTLTSAEQHLLDPVEGKTLILASTTNEGGDSRGLLWETWQKNDGSMAGCVKAYHQASVRIENMGATVQAPQQQRQQSAPPAAQQQSLPLQKTKAEDQFTRHLRECGVKYTRCFETARGIGSQFNLDLERVQGIATTLFIECKGREMIQEYMETHVHALSEIHDHQAPPRNPAPAATASTTAVADRKWSAKDNEWLYGKLANGSLQRAKLSKAGIEVLDEVWDEVEERSKSDEMAWANAYEVLRGLIIKQSTQECHKADINAIEDQWRRDFPSGNLFRTIMADAERFFIDVENQARSDNDIPM
jgi:hypothetical protein